MLLLLSGDISLNPGPTPSSVFQFFWKPFENRSLHFLHVDINSILPKLDELKTIAENTKAAIIGITECKVDNSIPDSEVEFQVTAFFDVKGTEMGEELNVMFGRICVLI